MIRRLLTGLVAASMLTILPAVPLDSTSALTDRTGKLTAPAQVTGDELFAVTLWLPDAVAAADGRITFQKGAAEVIGIAPTGSGDSFRPISTEDGASFGAFGLSPEQGATGLDIVLDARRSGRLQVRVVVDTAVDATGTAVNVRTREFLATVQVGAERAILVAPQIKDRMKAPRASRPARELQEDGRFDSSDLDLARVAWSQSRAQSRSTGPSCQAAPGTDPNADGCIDIADVQAVLAVQEDVLEADDTTESTESDMAVDATFTVTSTADRPDASPGNGVCADSRGQCTLRAAITESNRTTSADRIAFNLSGTAPVLIQLTGPLPTISARSAGVTIDGYTQPGSRVNNSTTSSNATPGVELRGNGFSARETGIYITSPNNTIRGLAMHNLHRSIFIDRADASNNRIVGNWIGFKRDGTSSIRGDLHITLNSGAHDNIIGTPTAGDRNVIGNVHHGIELYGRGTSGNVIQNNLLCMTPSGMSTASCTTGIDHNFGPKNGLIGGTGTNERNVIGPTGAQGIELSHGWNPSVGSANGGTIEWQVNGHRVAGNWVGFRGDGSYHADFRSATSNPGNSDNGQAINVYDGSNDNVIEANYVASHYDGIQFASANALRNIARGNFIGVSPRGQQAPMSRWGIKVRLGTRLHVLERNRIRNAAQGGIGLVQGDVSQIRITRNIIVATTGWAIDLYGRSGPDPNDSGDGDSGANSVLNTPVITTATTARIAGTGLPGATVEVYRATRTAGGFGLPNLYLGKTTVASNGAWSLAISRIAGERVTALQIRSNADTSELSANARLTGD